MAQDPIINSAEYWDERFVADWEAKGGPQQTRFFCRIAVDNLPAWLIHAIRHERWSLCDWGCALGDGTDLLHGLLRPASSLGIDISTRAVTRAKERYPHLDFRAIDLLKEPLAQPVDLLFTSNTPEHFREPWAVLEQLAASAARALVALVPANEFERHEEHFATFTPSNVPLYLGRDFALVGARLFDTSRVEGTWWSGQQFLLTYLSFAEIRRRGLVLADFPACVGPEVFPEVEELRRQLETAQDALAAARSDAARVTARTETLGVELQRAAHEREHALADAAASRLRAEESEARSDGLVSRLQQAADERERALADAAASRLRAEESEARSDGLVSQLQQAADERERALADAAASRLRAEEAEATSDRFAAELRQVRDEQERALAQATARATAWKQNVRALEDSWSWRVTAPLRVLGRTLRGEKAMVDTGPEGHPEIRAAHWERWAAAIRSSISWRITAPLRRLPAGVRVLLDTGNHANRARWVLRLAREQGLLAALRALHRRVWTGSAGLHAQPSSGVPSTEASACRPEQVAADPPEAAAALSPAFELITHPFNPYRLIEPLRPIPVEVIDQPYVGEVPPFSCVMTVLNEAASITKFLDSLAAQGAPPRELVLVDGGSTDGTVALVRRWAEASALPVKIIEAGPVNIAKGRNIGASLVGSGIVVFVDAGTELLPDFCRNLVGPFADRPALDAAGGLYTAKRPSVHAEPHVPCWSAPGFEWDRFLPSARALAVRAAAFRDAGGFPEHLTRTGEDTLFGIRLRQVSRRWAVCCAATVLWNAPTTAAACDRLIHSYAYGDGESGVGDSRAYPVLMGRTGDEALPAIWIEGYLAGRARRAEIEYHRRGIRRLIIMLSGVPFTDSGGGQRCSQLAMGFAKRDCKVVFVNIYPSFEEEKKIYFDVDLTLFEFYALRDFDAGDLGRRYAPFPDLEVLVISEFPHPSLLPVVAALKNVFQERAVTVYDYIDNWKTSLGWEWYRPEVEARFVAESDLLVASARSLRDQLQQTSGREVELIPNAVNDSLFDRRTAWERPSDLPAGGRTVSYVGAMWGDWFDWDLLADCARCMLDVQFVMIGGVDPARKADMQARHRNLHFLGLKPQRALPAYLAFANAAIIPFKPGDVTFFVNPLKVYEYVAMGVPVVASNMPEVAGIPGVTVTDGTEQFRNALQAAVESTPPLDDMLAFTGSNNWAQRIDAFLGLGRLPIVDDAAALGGSAADDPKRQWQGIVDPARVGRASADAVLDLYRKGTLHELELAVFRAFNRPSDLIVDVGANTGQSIASIRLLAPMARIAAFEPNPALWPTLERVAADLGNVEVFRCGLSDRAETRPFFTPVIDGLLMTPLSSVDIETLQAPSQRRYMRSLSRDGRVALLRTSVSLRVGDSFALQPTAIKVDVEGFELEVLNGLRGTLSRHRPLLLVEKRRVLVRLREFLAELGYQPMRLSDDATCLEPVDIRSPEEAPLNIVFIHDDKFADMADRGIPAGATEARPLPGTHGLSEPRATAANWISESARRLDRSRFAALMNTWQSSGRDVFLQLPTVEWNTSLFQRPQQMSMAMARSKALVAYFTWNANECPDGYKEIYPNVFLFSDISLLEDFTGAIASTYSTMSYRDFVGVSKNPIGFLEGIMEKNILLYEYIDHIDEAISRSEVGRLIEIKEFALRRADVVIASAQKLYDEVAAVTGDARAYLVPNGVDFDHYARALSRADAIPQELGEFAGRHSGLIGYFGALAPWLWYEMINELTEKRPDLGFVFIGPEYDNKRDALERRRNVLVTGPIPYAELPRYAKHFDVAIIPFRPGEIAQTTSPLKLFEYFALEKPVVVTDEMLECTVYPEVRRASDAEGFSREVDEALQTAGSQAMRARLRQLALDNTWDVRASVVLTAGRKALTRRPSNKRLRPTTSQA